MRIALNLSTSGSRTERYTYFWAIPTIVVGLAGLVLLSLSAVREFRKYRQVRGSLAEELEVESHVQERESALRKELEKPQFRAIFRDARFVNALIEKKQVSLIEVATKVTQLMPGQARLTGFALVPQGDSLVVRFMVTGRNEETVETFLGNLEDSPDFKEVAITNQGFDQSGAASGPVTITCTARYLSGAH